MGEKSIDGAVSGYLKFKKRQFKNQMGRRGNKGGNVATSQVAARNS